MFNKDITIINRYIDANHTPKYKVSHVKGYWSSNSGISINGTDLIKSNGLSARILMSQEKYQEPRDFEQNQTGWTLKKDDYLIKGNIQSSEIIGSVINLLKDYETMKITNIATKDYGSEDMWHWTITGE